jgi:arginine decarboxylase-like protein
LACADNKSIAFVSGNFNVVHPGQCGVSIVAIVDKNANETLFVGKQVVSDYGRLMAPVDAVIVTNVVNTRQAFSEAVRHYGPGRVLAPSLLGLNVFERPDAEQ